MTDTPDPDRKARRLLALIHRYQAGVNKAVAAINRGDPQKARSELLAVARNIGLTHDEPETRAVSVPRTVYIAAPKAHPMVRE